MYGPGARSTASVTKKNKRASVVISFIGKAIPFMGVPFIGVDQWLYTGKKTFPKIPAKKREIADGVSKKVLTP